MIALTSSEIIQHFKLTPHFFISYFWPFLEIEQSKSEEQNVGYNRTYVPAFWNMCLSCICSMRAIINAGTDIPSAVGFRVVAEVAPSAANTTQAPNLQGKAQSEGNHTK